MSMIIDVRTREEYEAEHVEGAVNIPVGDIDAGELGVLAGVSKDTPLLVHCLSGGRAGYACALLGAAGFTNVTNLGGLEEAMQTLLPE